MYKAKYLAFLLIVSLFIFCFTSSKPVYASENITDNWISQSRLPYNVANQTSFIKDNKLYILGGATDIKYDTISKAEIDNNNNITSWEIIESTLPQETVFQATTSKNGFVYLLGGATNPNLTPLDNVYLGIVNSNDEITWKPQKPLPVGSYLGKSIIAGDKIYYFGGVQNISGSEVSTNKVFFASISNDGTLGEWHETTSLKSTQPKSRFSVVYFANKVFTIGGTFSPDTPTNLVFESTIKSDGTLSDWQNTKSLPSITDGLSSAGVVLYNDYLIVVGGTTKINGTLADSNNIFYAKIFSDGSLDEWIVNSNKFPYHICCGTLDVFKDSLYWVGGYSTDINGGYNNIVLKTPIIKLGKNIILNIPDLKQIPPSMWAYDLYDKATIWSENPTISRWGCAITSADMILQYYGYSINPRDLNEWLIANNGYTRNGGVLWPSISSFTKKYSEGTKPTLEFAYHNPNTSLIASEIGENRPAVLKMLSTIGNTHFIVATGISNQDFNVNDPASKSENVNLLTKAISKWGENIKIGTFYPSHTDLSYIVLIIDNNINIRLYDTLKNLVSADYLSVEGPYADPNNLNNKSEGDTFKSLYYPKPINGLYKVVLSGAGSFVLDSYFYDTDGNVITKSITGLLDGNDQQINLYIDYRNNYQNIFYQNAKGIFDNLFKDLYEADHEGLILNHGLYKSVETLLNNAYKQYNDGIKVSPRILIKATLSRLSTASNEQINPEYSVILQDQLKLLADII